MKKTASIILAAALLVAAGAHADERTPPCTNSGVVQTVVGADAVSAHARLSQSCSTGEALVATLTSLWATLLSVRPTAAQVVRGWTSIGLTGPREVRYVPLPRPHPKKAPVVGFPDPHCPMFWFSNLCG